MFDGFLKLETHVSCICFHRCPSKYSGEHCEDKDGKKTDIALIVGLILAAILLAIIVGCCLKSKYLLASNI